MFRSKKSNLVVRSQVATPSQRGKKTSFQSLEGSINYIRDSDSSRNSQSPHFGIADIPMIGMASKSDARNYGDACKQILKLQTVSSVVTKTASQSKNRVT